MKFLLRLEKSYIRYSDLMCSNQALAVPLLSKKYNALRWIAFFMYEEFVMRFSPEYQQCVQVYFSNNRNYKVAAAILNVTENHLEKIISEIDAKMITFVGERTIDRINRAKTNHGIKSALSHFTKNVEQLNVHA